MKKLFITIVLSFFAITLKAQTSDTTHRSTGDTTIYSMAAFKSHAKNATPRVYLQVPVKYPPVELANGTAGTVKISFVIEKDGSFSNIRVIKKVSRGLDQEAIRVVKASALNHPFLLNGNPVRVRDTIPVHFSIGD